jgi:hypothetical protein
MIMRTGLVGQLCAQSMLVINARKKPTANRIENFMTVPYELK